MFMLYSRCYLHGNHLVDHSNERENEAGLSRDGTPCTDLLRPDGVTRAFDARLVGVNVVKVLHSEMVNKVQI